MALNETNPRPGDTEPELLRKILTLLGGQFSPGDTTEKITAKIILALSAALSSGGSAPTKTYVDAGDAATLASANSTSATLYVKKAGDTMTGQLAFAQPALAASNPSISDAQTWNNAAVTFTGWFFNVTNTASAAASLLFDFQFGGVSLLNLREDGRLVLGGRLSVGATVANAIQTNFTSAVNNSTVTSLLLNRNSSAGAAAGLGSSFDWGIDSTTTVARLAGRQTVSWTDATDATRTSQMVFQTVVAGTVQTALAFTSSGVAIPAGNVLAFNSGTNQRAGNTTLVGGTKAVANTTVTANTIVMLTKKTDGGTISTDITYTITAGVGFTINSANVLDTSTFSYLLIEVP